MAFFQSDYTKGCHPNVLSAIAQANEEELVGYGMDAHTTRAEKCILERCSLKEGAVFFVSGGTQANLSVIGSLLKPDESVLAADCGHICTQETGAIEATGHAVERLESTDGKVDAESLKEFCLSYETDDSASHLTKPALLYISFPNENGLTYTLDELETLSRICHEHGLFLYMDGARLAYGLAAQPDVTISDIARLCDVFYIGGTKCGALCAEAIVFRERKNALRFEARLRQRGALLARGWALATQFEALFNDDLYFELGKSANEYALCLRQAFEYAGIEVLSASRTNLQFVRLNPRQEQFLKTRCGFRVCKRFSDGTLKARFCTSWATTSVEIENLIADIEAMH